MATAKNRERLKELEEEQKVCFVYIKEDEPFVLLLVLCMQTIKNRLDQLDEQTQAINDHMTKISSCTPSEDEEVRYVCKC